MAKELTYFKIPDSKPSLDPLTPTEAKAIMRLFKYGKDETMIFVENGYPVHKIEAAKKEFLRLKDEVYKKVSGQEVTKPAVPPTYDKDGNEVSPGTSAEYYNPQNKTDLQNALSASSLFTAKEVVDDVLAYDEKNPAKPLTFTQLKDKYYPKKEQEIIKP